MAVCLCVWIVVCVRIARGPASNSPESGIGTETNTLTITISFWISIKNFHQITISLNCGGFWAGTPLSHQCKKHNCWQIEYFCHAQCLLRENHINEVDQLLAKRTLQHGTFGIYKAKTSFWHSLCFKSTFMLSNTLTLGVECTPLLAIYCAADLYHIMSKLWLVQININLHFSICCVGPFIM